MKSILSLITWVTFLIGVLSCNVYSPLNSNNSDLDKLEEAQRCLKDLNYNCAIAQYEGIKDSDLKEQKLCQVYLTKGGVTLTVLINTLNSPLDISKINRFRVSKNALHEFCRNF